MNDGTFSGISSDVASQSQVVAKGNYAEAALPSVRTLPRVGPMRWSAEDNGDSADIPAHYRALPEEGAPLPWPVVLGADVDAPGAPPVWDEGVFIE